MSVLLLPTSSIIEEENTRDHRIRNWISELRAHSPVDAFSPPSLPATPDLTPNPTTPTSNIEPQWQHSATRRSAHAPGPADCYIGARGVHTPSNDARNRELPVVPGPMPSALIEQYAPKGNVAMPTGAPPVLPNSGGTAPMTLSSFPQNSMHIVAALPVPPSIPHCIPPQIQLAPFPTAFAAPMAPPIIDIHPSRRSRSHSRSHRPSRHTIVVPEASSRLTIPRHGSRRKSRSRSRRRSPSPVRLPRDYVPVSTGPSPSSTRTRDRRSSRPRTRPIARDYATGATYPVMPTSSQRQPTTAIPHAHYDVSPRHHRHSHDSHHHHHTHGTSRQRALSQSYPYDSAQPVSSRPTYLRQRSHSVDARDPRMWRSRPGGAYPAQALAGPLMGYGRGQGSPAGSGSAVGYGSPSGSAGNGGSGRPYRSQAMPSQSSAYPSLQQQPLTQMPVPNTMGGYHPYQSSTGAPPTAGQLQMPMGNYPGQHPTRAPPTTAAMQPHINSTVLVPVSDGRGGWIYTYQGQNMQATNSAIGQPTTAANVMSRGRQSTPGFFSRVFGLGGRSRSAAPQGVYPVHASTRHQHAAIPVQYTNPRPRHLHRRSSR
ncbi:hypothetical protein BJ912DRAFT_958769 [Pholiota molesta]|nr:hypothetical protein BJ912DRAFT_958769 [Pholiota molesta]